VNIRLGCVAIEVASFAGLAHVVSSPNQRRCPIPAMERSVVLYGRTAPPNICLRLLGLWTSQKAVTDLEGPIAIRHEPQTRRSGVPLVRVKIIAVFVGLSAVEDRSLKLEPTIRKSRR